MKGKIRSKHVLGRCFLILLLIVVLYSTYLHRIVSERFDGKTWDIPSQVYSSAFVISSGMDVNKIGLLDRLRRLNYRTTEDVNASGDFDYSPDSVEIFLHDFEYPEGRLEGSKTRLELRNGIVHSILKLPSYDSLPSLKLEPELIGSFYGAQREERKIVSLPEVPPYLLDAVVTVEDRRFYQHHGIDLRGIGRAALTNLRERRISQGGSTITQQLVKNLFLEQKRDPFRKIDEIIMALLVEVTYSKRDILEAYLNEIYLGQRGPVSVCGVGQAAEFFFGRKVSELTLGQAALIAGIIKNPWRYSPYRDMREALDRRNSVLRRMRERGKITEEELRIASSEKMILAEATETKNRALYFLDFVTRKLEKKFSREVLISKGLRIFTTLDMRMQLEAEKTLEDGLKRLEESYPHLQIGESGEELQGALVAIDHSTGYITAMVGGRNYGMSQFNRVSQARRQPGSVFKPIVYLAALEGHRYTLASVIDDAPVIIRLKAGEWSPRNYDGQYHGKVTLRKALEESLNAATVRLTQEIGIAKVVELAHSLGIGTPLPEVPSLALGSVELTPLEITEAYAVMANGGIRRESMAVTTVVDRSGRVLLENKFKGTRVLSQEASYLITYLLKGVVKEGTASKLREMGFTGPVAAKTGTSSSYKDAWFVGYTPDMVLGVWVGFDHNKPLNLSGSEASLPLWMEFMASIERGDSTPDFTVPEGIAFMEIDKETGGLATGACPNVVHEAFIRGTEPREFCLVHRENFIQWLRRKIFGRRGEEY